jgi:hypothetical protein
VQGPAGATGATGPAAPGNSLTLVTNTQTCTTGAGNGSTCQYFQTVTCPAGTQPVGCGVFPDMICDAGNDRTDGVFPEAVPPSTTVNGCAAGYVTETSACGRETVMITVYAQCIDIP